MKNTTDEFSFVLKPGSHGIGVFAAHDIKEGTHLRLFADEKTHDHLIRSLKKEDIPDAFKDLCIDRGNTMLCPPDFGAMPVGWYLNHSSVPNAGHHGENEVEHRRYQWYALRDIKSGEEITIDYNSLEEPEKGKEDFYWN